MSRPTPEPAKIDATDPLLADAELFFFPAYTQPYCDPEELAHARFRKVVGDALTEARAEGYRQAIADLRARARLERDENPNSPTMWAVYLASADYLESRVAREGNHD